MIGSGWHRDPGRRCVGGARCGGVCLPRPAVVSPSSGPAAAAALRQRGVEVFLDVGFRVAGGNDGGATAVREEGHLAGRGAAAAVALPPRLGFGGGADEGVPRVDGTTARPAAVRCPARRPVAPALPFPFGRRCGFGGAASVRVGAFDADRAAATPPAGARPLVLGVDGVVVAAAAVARLAAAGDLTADGMVVLELRRGVVDGGGGGRAARPAQRWAARPAPTGGSGGGSLADAAPALAPAAVRGGPSSSSGLLLREAFLNR